ncbi:cysteine proteinase 1-like [Choristoneura fumiferana]|uniref:cysteine proteinase 1-like n=1 Tax=Choristoneura fumiferana TaxID=7141 RepID=UPI003D15C033
MFSIIYVSLFVSKALAALTADKPYYDLADAENHFAEFVQEYDKKYGSHEEYNKRFEIFKNKLLHINKLNEEHDATFGVNKFSDLTFEEFASSRFSVIPSKDVNATEMITVKKEWVINAPKSLDYRTLNMVTHVKEQGFECTPSDVFAAIGNIEGQYAKKHKKLVTLSEQQIIDCVINSCRSPSVSKLLSDICKTDGCVSEEHYPYAGELTACQTGSKIEVKLKGFQELVVKNEDQLVGATAHYGPIYTRLFLPSGAESYRGGIWAPTDCSSATNSAILVVGYGTDARSGKDFWILKNSWGSDWGEMGYLMLERGKSLCWIGSSCATSIVQ